MKRNLFTALRVACMTGLLLIFVCSCQTEAGDTSNKKIRISPRLPEQEIRAQILNYTPIGSSLEDCLKFAQLRLKHADGEPDNDKPNHNIVVLLGRYGLSQETYIGWLFDEHDKLIDVRVRKYRDSL